MSRISTHILDVTLGLPAKDIPVRLERQDGSGWQLLASSQTDQDGRCVELLPQDEPFVPGTYRLGFDTAEYFGRNNVQGLYPRVVVTFLVRSGEQHFHIPLLLSPNGYTTYRGS